jgi:hypothetical protein
VFLAATSPGDWFPEVCSSPSFWIYLYGQYRTFDITKRNLAIVANKTAGRCFFISAVTDEAQGYNGGNKDKVKQVSVLESLERARVELFGGNMAYAVVRRTGCYDRSVALQGALDFWWYSVFLLSEMAASFHRFKPNPSALVLRTRFVIARTTYTDLCPCK